MSPIESDGPYTAIFDKLGWGRVENAQALGSTQK
jgi:hypothetical protein